MVVDESGYYCNWLFFFELFFQILKKGRLTIEIWMKGDW